MIGAGLTGLAVALRRGRAGDRVSIFEADARAGGQLHTIREGGFVVEQGAEGYVASSASVPELAAEVGVSDEIVAQRLERSLGFDGERLVALAPGEAARFLGFQVPPGELGRGIRSLRPGMGRLADALVAEMPAEVGLHLGAAVERVVPASSGLSVELAEGPSEPFDAVVVATGARAAAPILASLAPSARALGSAATLSSVTVSLAFGASDVPHDLDATGFVVAERAQRDGLRACTFTSSKLPARSPDDAALLRLFFRPSEADLEALDDAAWSERARVAIERVLGIRAQPLRTWVARWVRALPVHDEHHTALVASIEAELAGRRVLLAGSAFHGAGIDAALRSALRAARALAS